MSNVNVVDLWKFTPLHEAAAKGKYEICKLLLKVSYKQICRVCLYVYKCVNCIPFINYNPVPSSPSFSLCLTFPLSVTPFFHSLTSPSLISLLPLLSPLSPPLPLSLAWCRH